MLNTDASLYGGSGVGNLGAITAEARPLHGMDASATVTLTANVRASAIERTYRMVPERLTAVMIAGLGIKAVFFGVYVAVMLRPLALRATPFVASFTGYFIALHMMEALFMRRLFADGMRVVR